VRKQNSASRETLFRILKIIWETYSIAVKHENEKEHVNTEVFNIKYVVLFMCFFTLILCIDT